MNLKFAFSISLSVLLFACGGEKDQESKKKSTKKEIEKESVQPIPPLKDRIVGDWLAYEVAETPEDELKALPSTAEVYLVIKEDLSYCTLFELDTVTDGEYRIEGDQVVFQEKKNYMGGELRYLTTKILFEEDQMEMVGEWSEPDGMKEYHHSSFIKKEYNSARIAERQKIKKKH